MKAAIYHEFQNSISLSDVADPEPSPKSVVLEVHATGICRSDWHGWMGHDSDIKLPHIPGHELAGKIVELGTEVTGWRVGDRVTTPFVCGCGDCRECVGGNPQVCSSQFQPGFTHWGSFAQYVEIKFAQNNLVALPEEFPYETAAALGCRFGTAFRAIVEVGQLKENHWLAVHGCGGVGLSCIMIAKAIGAKVIAIDSSDSAIMAGIKLGADTTINTNGSANIIEDILDASDGGVHVSVDALGNTETAGNSILCLRPRGKHIQVGLLVGEHENPKIPMGPVIAKELSIMGSHGIASSSYRKIFQLINEHKLDPSKLIQSRCTLSEGAKILEGFQSYKQSGITVINDLNK